MFKLARSLVIFIFLISFSNISAKTEVQLELKKVEFSTDPKVNETKALVKVGKPFTAVVSLINASGESSPKIEGSQNFSSIGVRSNKCMQYSFVNGKAQSIATHSFEHEFVAKEPGDYTLGPVSIEINGKTYKSKSYKIKATATKDSGVAKNSIYVNGHEFFMDISVDKDKVFIGEPIVLTIKFYHEISLSDFAIKPMNFSGFQVKDIIGSEKSYIAPVDERRFGVMQKQILLTPLSSGKFEVGPVEGIMTIPMSLGFFMINQGEPHEIKSNKVPVVVQDLPKSNIPILGVGEFSRFNLVSSEEKAKVNEAIKITLELEGSASFDSIFPPKLDLPEDKFVVYEPSSKFVAKEDKGLLYGTKYFEYVVQPKIAGEFTIPAQTFTYFDSKTGSIKKLVSNDLKLIVLPSKTANVQKIEKKENVTSESKEKMAKKDLLIPYFEKQKSYPMGSIPFWLYLILIFIPLLFVTYRFIYDSTKYLMERFFKFNSSKKVLQKELATILKNKKVENLYQFFLNAASFTFDIPAHLVSYEIIKEKLRKNNNLDKSAVEFLNYLNECAELKYSYFGATGEHKTELLAHASKNLDFIFSLKKIS